MEQGKEGMGWDRDEVQRKGASECTESQAKVDVSVGQRDGWYRRGMGVMVRRVVAGHGKDVAA